MAKTKALKIAFLFDDSLDRTDGVQQYIKALGNWMHGQGHDVTYLVGETHHAVGYEGHVYSLAKNVGVKGNQNTLSVPLPARAGEINKILKNHDFDVIHVQMPYNPLLASRVIARASSSTAVVATFHIVGETVFQQYGSALLRLVQSRSMKRIDQFLAVSTAARDFAKKRFSINPEISPNVVNIDKFKVAKTKSMENPHILFLGRLDKRKGAQHLIAALARIHQQLRDQKAQVTIAGDGPMRSQLEKLVAELELEDIVHFIGFVPEADKATVMASCDLAVFPSTGGESFGIVLVEAMATGGPVVLGGDNVGYRTVLGEKPELLINPADYEAFSRRILLLLNDKSQRSNLLRWQKRRADNFSVNKIGPEVEAIYRKSIKHKLDD